MKKNEPIYEWDSESGIATCILTDKNNNVFYGVAHCHPEDADMMSEKTGCAIAHLRAYIKYLQFQKENITKPQLAVLKQLYYSMNHSKYFNPKSYEHIMLQRKISEKEDDLEVMKTSIAEMKSQLNLYIEEKEKFYQKVRTHRTADKVNS